MNDVNQDTEIRVNFSKTTVDIFSGSGMETRHLAHMERVDKQIPNAIVSFVYIAGNIVPMHVRLFNHTDRISLGEAAIYEQLVNMINSTNQISHKLLILYTITEPLQLDIQGRYAIVSSGTKRMITFSLDPTPSACTYTVPGQKGLYHVLSTFVDQNNPDRATRDTMIQKILDLIDAEVVCPTDISPTMRPITDERPHLH